MAGRFKANAGAVAAALKLLKTTRGKGGMLKRAGAKPMGAAKSKGKGAGSWVFVPTGAKGFGKGVQGKGRGKDAPKSKFMEKLGQIESEKKVWIGGLSPKTTWKTLEKHFVGLVGEKPGISEVMPNGKACVAFKSEGDASTAIALANGSQLDGKTIKADVWTQKEKREKPMGKKPMVQKPKGKKLMQKKQLLKKAGKPTRTDPKLKVKLQAVDDELKVWVGGLKPDTTAGALRKHFTVAGCKPHLVNLTGKDRACVSFRSSDDASAAISTMSATELDGETIEVDVWTKVEKAAK